MKRLLAKSKGFSSSGDTPHSFFEDIEIEFLIHELKDPVAIIETGARTLLERREKFGDLNPRQERTLKRILRNAKKARSMMYDLLEIGRSEAGCFICCDFMPTRATMEALVDALELSGDHLRFDSRNIDDLRETFIRRGIFIDIDPSLEKATMFQDETKFKQITGNLIKNALKYRHERLDIRLSSDQKGFCLEVVDDGPGIAPEHHETIFKQYAQGQSCSLSPRQGHGLGLAGAKILARCLGGDIDLKSQMGQGATFRLVLPLEYREER